MHILFTDGHIPSCLGSTFCHLFFLHLARHQTTMLEGWTPFFHVWRDRSVFPSSITCVLDKSTPNEKGNQKITISHITGNGYCSRQARELSIKKFLLCLYLLICPVMDGVTTTQLVSRPTESHQWRYKYNKEDAVSTQESTHVAFRPHSLSISL